jgi:hypothetical protein
MSEIIDLSDEGGRWQAKDVKYIRGRWNHIREQLPVFKTEDFKAYASGPANPYLRSVVRVPRTLLEQAIPVGVVSNTYTLAQHRDVAAKCLEGIEAAGIKADGLECEVGLTELGEWMNFRIYFPHKFSYSPRDDEEVGLRLECFNSVDRSSSLVLFLGWLRFVCSNGLVIGETRVELKDIHNKHMDLEKIPDLIQGGLDFVDKDREQLGNWERIGVKPAQVASWADKVIPEHWGKKAACRIFHICSSGCDVEYEDPFAQGDPTTKPVKLLEHVPGAPDRAENLYDVSQAMSWVASTRPNPDERIDWQTQIPGLVGRLAQMAG